MIRVISRLVEDGLRELADEETQTRLWQAAQGPEISSFTEAIETLWDDSGLASAMDHGVVYSTRIDEQLRQLGSVLHRIDSAAPVKTILANPYLKEARQRARVLLDELAQFGNNDEGA